MRRGRLRALQARAHGLRHERPRPPPGGRPRDRRAWSRPARRWRVTYKDVERAKAILVVGLDAEQEVPILHLRLRKAAKRGARIWVLHPRRTRLHDVATHVLCRARRRSAGPGGAGSSRSSTPRSPPCARPATPGVVIAGERDGAGRALARTGSPATGRGPVRARDPPRERPRGPPGRGAPGAAARWPPFDVEEPDEVEAAWGPLMNREPGRDSHAILQACADREIDVLFLRRGRPAARPARRRARAPGARERRHRSWCSRSSSARWNPTPTRSCPPRRSSRRKATSPTGRAGASGCSRSAAPRGSACPTGRSSRAWRWRAAATSASSRWRSCMRRWVRSSRRGRSGSRPAPAPGARRRRGAPALHLPAPGRRRPAVRARR